MILPDASLPPLLASGDLGVDPLDDARVRPAPIEPIGRPPDR